MMQSFRLTVARREPGDCWARGETRRPLGLGDERPRAADVVQAGHISQGRATPSRRAGSSPRSQDRGIVPTSARENITLPPARIAEGGRRRAQREIVTASSRKEHKCAGPNRNPGLRAQPAKSWSRGVGDEPEIRCSISPPAASTSAPRGNPAASTLAPTEACNPHISSELEEVPRGRRVSPARGRT